MAHKTHEGHAHQHSDSCGHTRIRHEDHVDYVHDGHLHSAHGDHVDEHVLAVSKDQPDSCSGSHSCDGHNQTHRHGAGCGHESVPHADHTDYIVAGHLHNQHSEHCDNHGAVTVA